MENIDQIDAALAVVELADGDLGTLRAVEGYLLQAGVENSAISPRSIAKATTLPTGAARDLCRQLESIGAAERLSAPSDPLDSEYSCNQEIVAEFCETAVFAAKVLARDQERRQPQTAVQPLVTLPADPSFNDVTPEEYGFEWLMPSVSNAINQASERVQILMPFFEEDGFRKLEQSLIAALQRDVSVTIVGRYLSDRDSHNRYVLSGFVERCREEGVPLSNLNLIDYTAWDDDATSGQNGDQPSFTLHAKVIIFDDERAYIGSANVTDYGFERYLELGVLLDGPDVAGFGRMVTRLLQSPAATVVDL
jgi:phosphatidylserine/phosphatidylglycerophosphate/cardiolipin synthase-like enzyme